MISINIEENPAQDTLRELIQFTIGSHNFIGSPLPLHSPLRLLSASQTAFQQLHQVSWRVHKFRSLQRGRAGVCPLDVAFKDCNCGRDIVWYHKIDPAEKHSNATNDMIVLKQTLDIKDEASTIAARLLTNTLAACTIYGRVPDAVLMSSLLTAQVLCLCSWWGS